MVDPGNDIYEWSVGDGNDYIVEEGGADTLKLHGVLENDVTYTKYLNHLKIEIGAETVTVHNFFISEIYKLENVVFDDGTVVNLPEMLNEAPIANDDDIILDQDQIISGNVLVSNGHGADIDPEGNALTVIAGTYATANGSIVLAANGDFTYTPNAGYNGYDSYVYTVQDEYGVTDTALVNITIRPPNVAPIAQDDDFVGDQDIDVTGNVLSNNGNGADSDPDSDPITVIAGTFATTNGSVTISSNGSFTYTPNTGYVGTDSFTYTLQDDRGGSDVGTVNITLNELVSNPNAINGTSGNDYLYGDPLGVSNDTLIGNGGSDYLYGGYGDDVYVFNAGDGSDTVSEYTGQGTDTIHFAGGIVADDIRLWTNNYGHLYLNNDATGDQIIAYAARTNTNGSSQSLIGDYVERITFDDGTIWDLTGGLNISGSTANDSLYGTTYDDTVSGKDGNDTLFGNSGNDTVIGGAGSDYLYGGYGDDVVIGGEGVDMLYGQAGADTFVFDDLNASDNIQDFSLADGDKLDVSSLITGYDPLTDAITDFVQITESGSHSYLSVDADGGADNFIQIAYIYNQTGLTDEEALETSGNLITA